MERPGEPRSRRSNRKSSETAAQSLVALLLLSSASGCATYDMDRARPMAAKARPYSAKAITYTVENGDTVSSIARAFGVSRETLIAANNFNNPHTLRPGQRILVPRGSGKSRAVSRDARVQHAALRSRQVTPESRDLDAPYVDPRLEGARYYVFEGPRTKPGDSREVRVDVVDAGSSVDLDAPYEGKAKRAKNFSVARDAGNFVWPVRGKVISTYGSHGSGQHNDGINIAAEVGAQVKAAEGGVVIYAGNQLLSYGNLLLIRHPSGYVTAYAHNKRLLVKKEDKVKRGQKIALVGATGDVTEPQLHFEIRRGDKPVNPRDYLEMATASR